MKNGFSSSARLNKANQHRSLRSLDSLALVFLCMAAPSLHKNTTASLPLLAAL